MADRSLHKAVGEGAAAAVGDGAMAILAVRQDSFSALAADGKWSPLYVNASGELLTTATLSGSITIGSLEGEVAHDAAASGTKPVLAGGYASAAAPADVSGDGDAVNAWHLRNGAQAVALTAAGALIGGDATNGLDVDVTRLPTDLVFTDDAVYTPGTSKLLVVGAQADDAATDSVDEGDAGALRMTLDRKLITSPQAHASGGATPGMLISAASTNATSVKGSAGTLYSLVVTNINAAVRYLKLYNKATAPDENDTPVQVYAIPGATTGGGLTVPIPACGIAFSSGIGLRLTTGVANNDTGSVSANEHTVSYSYK